MSAPQSPIAGPTEPAGGKVDLGGYLTAIEARIRASWLAGRLRAHQTAVLAPRALGPFFPFE